MDAEKLYGRLLALVMTTPDDEWAMFHGLVQPLADEVVLAYDVGKSRVLTERMLEAVKPVPPELADTLQHAEFMIAMKVRELPEP